MRQEIRLWEIDGGENLLECPATALNLESRLEDWLDNDISVLANDLMVIGRQVETDFGGFIDLLCMNNEGDLVIVELKRDKTPREVTAQALDYASWVRDLPSDRIESIFEKYPQQGKSLEQAFSHRFKRSLPESLNEDHQIVIVGSAIDPSTERIVKYLSDSHGVNINVATFCYFKKNNGRELLARVFLIDPNLTPPNRPPKRRPNLTYKQLEELAENNGVGSLYRELINGLEPHFQRHTTRSSIVFTSNLESSRKAVLSLIPGESNSDQGLHFQIYLARFQQAFEFSEDHVDGILPKCKKPWVYYAGAGDDYSGYSGYFRDLPELHQFLKGLSGEPKQNN